MPGTRYIRFVPNEHIPKPMLEILKGYDSDHQHPLNQKMHYLIVPGVTLSTLGLFSYIPVLPEYGIDGYFILALVNFLYFVRLDWKLSTLFIAIITGFYFLLRDLSLEIFVVGFFASWALGFISHKFIEKNKPAMTKNVKEAVLGVGPITLLAKLIGYYKPNYK